MSIAVLWNTACNDRVKRCIWGPARWAQQYSTYPALRKVSRTHFKGRRREPAAQSWPVSHQITDGTARSFHSGALKVNQQSLSSTSDCHFKHLIKYWFIYSLLWIHWDEPAGISFPFLSSWMVPPVLLSLFCFFLLFKCFFFFPLSTFWPQAGDVRKDLSRETKPRGQMWDFSNTGCEIGLLERLPQRRRKNDKNHKIKNVPPESVQPVTWKFLKYLLI